MPDAMGGDDLVVGIDLGGTKALGVVLDPASDDGPLLVQRVPTPRGADALIEALDGLAADLGKQARAHYGRGIGAVGLGAPGLVDRSGVFRFGANLPDVVDVNVADRLQEVVGVPVAVDNDATCAAWGEHERGAARGRDHAALVTLGTGIGAGFVVAGQIMRGAEGFAGEAGHMVVDPSGPICPCGRRGCWERFGSGRGLRRLGVEAAEAGIADRIVELAGGDTGDVQGEHVTQAAAEGDEQAQAVMASFGWWVALGIANLVDLFDPDVVVVGGGLVRAGSVVMDPIRAAYEGEAYGASHRRAVPIVQAELGEQAGAVGAALLGAARA